MKKSSKIQRFVQRFSTTIDFFCSNFAPDFGKLPKSGDFFVHKIGMFNQVKSMYFNATKINSERIVIDQVDTLPTTAIGALLQKFDGEYVVFTARTERGRIPLLEDEYNVTFPQSSKYANRYCRIRRLRPIEQKMSIEKIQQYELRRYRTCCKYGGLSVSILWAPYKNKQKTNKDGISI